MAGLKALDAVLGWFSPEQRAKAKRSKLEALKNERVEIMKKPCTVKTTERVQEIDKQIEAIDRDLRS